MLNGEAVDVIFDGSTTIVNGEIVPESKTEHVVLHGEGR